MPAAASLDVSEVGSSSGASCEVLSTADGEGDVSAVLIRGSGGDPKGDTGTGGRELARGRTEGEAGGGGKLDCEIRGAEETGPRTLGTLGVGRLMAPARPAGGRLAGRGGLLRGRGGTVGCRPVLGGTLAGVPSRDRPLNVAEGGMLPERWPSCRLATFLRGGGNGWEGVGLAVAGMLADRERGGGRGGL